MLIPLLLMALAAMATNDIPIPPQYQKNTVVVLHTVTQDGIDKHCGASPAPFYTTSCQDVGTNIIWMPNPCLDKDAKDPDSYSHMLCHEIAHVEGWHHIDE